MGYPTEIETTTFENEKIGNMMQDICAINP